MISQLTTILYFFSSIFPQQFTFAQLDDTKSSFDRGSSLNAKGPLLQTVWKQAKEWATAAGNEELAKHYRFMYEMREDEIARIRAQLDAEEQERIKQGLELETATIVTTM
jgi:hypothetical protein